MNLYIISGATGMTGSELIAQLLKDDHFVIAFDNFFASDIKSIERYIKNSNLTFFEYDLNNYNQMETIKKCVIKDKEKVDKVIFINCAAVVHTEYFYEVNSTFETNVVGMKHFLDMAIDVGADIYINCSTSEVYSMQSFIRGGVKEDSPLSFATAEHSQRTSYAAGKLLTEFFMKDAIDKGLIKGCSIRFANVYSNNELYPKHIIPHIINSLSKKSEVVLLENSRKTYRTFLHNIDSCSGVLALCNNPDALDGSVYNIATTQEILIIDLVKMIADKMRIKNYSVRYEGVRLSDPTRRFLSIDKIKKRTKWEPVIDLDRGLSMCVENYKINEVK